MSDINNVITTAQKPTFVDFRDEVNKDLRKVLEAEKAGNRRPSYGRLAAFFQDKFGVRVHAETIRVYYNRLRNESDGD